MDMLRRLALLLLLLLLMGATGGRWTRHGATAYVRPPRHVADNTPPEMWMSTPELIEYAGFRAESHMVRTEDGYLLTLHRILPREPTTTPAAANDKGGGGGGHQDDDDSKQQQQQPHGTPVLLTHGMASSSEQWVLRMDSDNLAFQLVDQGFDVWLANLRGSFYGRKHERLSPTQRKFWDFSWHENGVYDLAALIDHVLAHTNRTSLATLSHSMGCTSQIVLLAERPEFAAKVRAGMLLAPSVYFAYPSAAMLLVAIAGVAMPAIKDAYSTHVVNDIFPGFVMPMFPLCYQIGRGSAMMPYCEAGLKFLVGPYKAPRDSKLLQVGSAHFPYGSSIRQVAHYGQSIIRGGDFRKYDFGPAKNRAMYGTAEPPIYNISKITTPLYLYYGADDHLVNFKDVETFARDVGPVVQRLYKIPNFSHLDFIVGMEEVKDVNRFVVQDLNKYV